MRIGFRTTIEEELLSKLKISAIEKRINVNDILEMLIEEYLINDGKINNHPIHRLDNNQTK